MQGVASFIMAALSPPVGPGPPPLPFVKVAVLGYKGCGKSTLIVNLPGTNAATSSGRGVERALRSYRGSRSISHPSALCIVVVISLWRACRGAVFIAARCGRQAPRLGPALRLGSPGASPSSSSQPAAQQQQQRGKWRIGISRRGPHCPRPSIDRPGLGHQAAPPPAATGPAAARHGPAGGVMAGGGRAAAARPGRRGGRGRSNTTTEGDC